MGFGSTPEDFERKGGRHTECLNGVSGESVQMVADGMRLDVAKIISTQELAVADQDLATASGVVRKGSVAGQHWRWVGLTADGIERIALETIWRMHHAVAPEWAKGNDAIAFNGAPMMHLEFPPNFGMSDGLLGTAMQAVNSIPYVVGALPGIQILLDLPLIAYKPSGA